jgi:hypothetical protein
MNAKNRYPDDPTAPQRRKNLTEKEIEELELAGGVEGGMQAGGAAGSGENESPSKKPRKAVADQ